MVCPPEIESINKSIGPSHRREWADSSVSLWLHPGREQMQGPGQSEPVSLGTHFVGATLSPRPSAFSVSPSQDEAQLGPLTSFCFSPASVSLTSVWVWQSAPHAFMSCACVRQSQRCFECLKSTEMASYFTGFLIFFTGILRSRNHRNCFIFQLLTARNVPAPC